MDGLARGTRHRHEIHKPYRERGRRTAGGVWALLHAGKERGTRRGEAMRGWPAVHAAPRVQEGCHAQWQGPRPRSPLGRLCAQQRPLASCAHGPRAVCKGARASVRPGILRRNALAHQGLDPHLPGAQYVHYPRRERWARFHTPSSGRDANPLQAGRSVECGGSLRAGQRGLAAHPRPKPLLPKDLRPRPHGSGRRERGPLCRGHLPGQRRRVARLLLPQPGPTLRRERCRSTVAAARIQPVRGKRV